MEDHSKEEKLGKEAGDQIRKPVPPPTEEPLISRKAEKRIVSLSEVH